MPTGTGNPLNRPRAGQRLAQTWLADLATMITPIEVTALDEDPDVLKNSLHEFVKQAWFVIEPGRFIDNWHIGAICEHLEAVSRGEIHNLVINMPPRHAKSNIVSVLWPAWEWISTPQSRWFYTSYALSLALRDSVKTRRLLQSSWFQRRWGYAFKLLWDQNTKSRFENNLGGVRLSSSVDGGVTGEGGDKIVADDPHNAKEITSDVSRLAVLEWWDKAMSTRLNDPKSGANVIVMQRLHPQDLAGHVLAQGGWEHLRLPAEWDDKYRTVTGTGWSDPRSVHGELLWPNRFDGEAMAKLKSSLADQAPAQLQQDPIAPGGNMVKRWWWRYWVPEGVTMPPVEVIGPDGEVIQCENVELPESFDEIAASWDCTFKDTKSADRVAGGVYGLSGANLFKLDDSHGRMDIVATIDAITTLRNRWPLTSFILIEDKANGPAILSILRNKIPGLLPFTPDTVGNKVVRLRAAMPFIEAGNIILPHPKLAGFGWVDEMVNEIVGFPGAPYDDYVDELSQIVIRWFGTGGWGVVG